MLTKADFIEVMAKHLPPSASDLRLLDIGGVVGETLLEHRHDLSIDIASVIAQHWNYESNSFDAVVAYDILLKPQLLAKVLDTMRPGGRFIVVNPLGDVEEQWVMILESAGYIRILVEAATSGGGVLIRGEKAHHTEDTFKRVEDVAKRDADLLDLDQYKGRYVHLLIVQSPNKPVWKLQADEQIAWQAVVVEAQDEIMLLAFTSLPKAVSFMQTAVMNGFIRDVNKVGKFSKDTARTWNMVTLLNPTLYNIQNYRVRLIHIDPNSAEASDE